MKRPLALTLLTLLLPVGAALAAGPRAVAPETVIDVGPVIQGDEIVREFKIQNAGDADLEITEIKSSCGCLVASYARIVKPGRVGLVKLVVSTDDFATPIAKGATVFTSDPANPRIQLVVKANVKAVVQVKPGYARFIVVQGEKYETSEQVLEAPDQADFRVTRVTSPYPFLKAEIAPPAAPAEGEDSKPGKWKVVLSLRPDAPIGPMADFVVATTNHPKLKQVKIPVSGFVRPPVAVMPTVYDFGSRSLDEEYPGAVEVEVLSSRPVHLGEATADRAGISATIEEIEAGRRYNVVIRLAPDLPVGKIDGVVSVTTDDARYPTLEIPVTGTVL
jgi:Protein of unknown function (DUF1573)